MTGVAPSTLPEAANVPPPPRRVNIAAGAACISILAGFIPLHFIWAMGIPLFEYEDKFQEWHADGGGVYLFALNGMALLAAILPMSLVRPWGLAFPRWVPFVAGRRVPPRLLTWPATGVAVLLLLYTALVSVLLFAQYNHPDKIFNPWVAILGIPQFLVWGVGLLIAARSYHVRTQGGTHSRQPFAARP